MKLSGITFQGILGILVFLSSCSSDTGAPSPNEVSKVSESIVLSLNVEDLSTRADNSYKLRYVAQIFQGSSSNSWDTPESRQEIIDGESQQNQIVFKVAADKDYTIMVFADYVPSTSLPTDGLYNDYFYDTHTISKSVSILTTPGNKNNQNISADFFNNEHYDCFYAIETFHKDQYEKVINLTLKRVTSKVVFKDKTGTPGNYTVTVNNLSFRPRLDFGTTYTTTEMSDTEFNKGCNVSLNVVSVSSESTPLFFFYTLAQTQQKYVKATVTLSTGSNNKKTQVTDIPVRSNFQTIVTGDFLPSSTIQPGDDSQNKPGDVILNLSTDYSWEQSSLNK